MRDPRGARLAQLIVQPSLQLQSGEAVLIESFDLADGLVLDLIDAVHAVGAHPLVSVRSNAVIRSQLGRATEAYLNIQSRIELHQMQQVQAYVGLRAATNAAELS